MDFCLGNDLLVTMSGKGGRNKHWCLANVACWCPQGVDCDGWLDGDQFVEDIVLKLEAKGLLHQVHEDVSLWWRLLRVPDRHTPRRQEGLCRQRQILAWVDVEGAPLKAPPALPAHNQQLVSS